MAQPSASDHGSSSEITYMDAALYKAAADGDINVLKSSLADFRIQLTPKKNTVLHIAAQFGQADCIDWILRQDSCLSLLLQPNLKGNIPLQLAARGGHPKAVKSLLDAAKALPKEIEGGVEANKAMLRMTNNEGDTALHEAVRFQCSKVVKLLTEEDSSLTTAANIHGETPLYIAAEGGLCELVKIIIDRTVSISPAHTGFKGNTALHAAVIGNHKETVKKILQWKPDLAKEVDEKGWSPLHSAAYLGHTSIMKELLEKCEKSLVYLGVKNDDNKTALHIAASRGHVDIVKLLVSHSPDCCEQEDDKGNNALHFLKPESNLLFSRWMNVRGLLNEKNDRGQTPVHLLKSIFMPHNNIIFRDITYAMLIFIPQEVPFISLWRSAEARSALQKMAEGEEISSSSESQEISEIKKASEYHLIVAALIATITFAAGFSIPGGYIQSEGENQGVAIRATNNTFANKSNYSSFVSYEDFVVFIWEDAIALVLSMTAVAIYFLMALYNNKQILRKLFYYAYCLTLLSICVTLLAFWSGMSAILPPSNFLGRSLAIMAGLFLWILAVILALSPPPDNTLLFDQRKYFSPCLVGCLFPFIWLIMTILASSFL